MRSGNLRMLSVDVISIYEAPMCGYLGLVGLQLGLASELGLASAVASTIPHSLNTSCTYGNSKKQYKPIVWLPSADLHIHRYTFYLWPFKARLDKFWHNKNILGKTVTI